MSKIVEVPGIGNVEFPDGMGDEQVAQAIKANYLRGPDIDPRMPYQQSPEGRAVAQRYGVLPSQLQEARQTVIEDIRATPRITAKTLTRGLPAAIGAILGAASPVPGGALIGGGLGYSIGGRLEELFGLEDRPASAMEATEKAVGDIPVGAMYEMGGQAMGALGSKLLAPRAGAVTPQGQQLKATLEKAGVTANPVDVAPGGVWGKLEPMAAKQIGGGRITEAGKREMAAMRGDPDTGAEGWLGKEARRVSGPNHQLDASRVSRGETIQTGLKDIAEAHRVGEAVEWEFPKAQATGVPDFSIEGLRQRARDIMARAGEAKQAVKPQTSSRLSSTGGRITGEGAFVTEQATSSGMTPSEIVSGLAQGKGKVTLQEAMALRRQLGELYKQDKYKSLLGGLREDMDADAILNPARAKAWDAARAYTRENTVPFQHDQPLGRLIDKNEPMAVVNELMQPRDARINLLRAVEKQTGRSGPVWESTTSEALTRAIEDPRMLKTLGDETKKILFTKEQRAFLQEMQNWSETSRAAIRSRQELHANTGTNIVSFDQLRHGVTLLVGGLTAAGGAAGASPAALAGGATILLTPNIVARMVTNPATALWLSEGFKMSASSPDALRVLSQLIPAYLRAVGEEKATTRRPQ